MAKSRSRKTHKSPQADNEKLLLAIVAQTPFDGWTQAAMDSGAQRLGMKAVDMQTAFPRGIRDVTAAFSAWANARMLERIGREKLFDKMRTRDKIAFALRARLEALTPHREAMRQLALWYALPHHAPDALRNLGKLADSIWQAAGDTSTDYNFYTKRGLLAGVIKATMLFWLHDQSEGQEATWAFLDRRIAEVLKLGKALGKLRDVPKQWNRLDALADILGRFRRAA